MFFEPVIEGASIYFISYVFYGEFNQIYLIKTVLMKKIAFIASGHAGSTMPLIKSFIDKGFIVDYYILCNRVIRNIEATDCNYTPTKRGIEEIPSNNWALLSKEYLKSKNIKFYSVSTNRPFEKSAILNKIVGIVRTVEIKKICTYINKQNYEFVNFIGRYQVSDIIRYGKYITSKYIVSLHEVCNHLKPDFNHPNDVLRFLFKNKIPIVLFSDKSKEDIQHYKGVNNVSLYRQNFGKFESFIIYKGRRTLDLPENYVLFIGRLTPYKGLRIFYEATKELADRGYRFVVAGNGEDEALKDILNTSNYTVFNRYLADEEFVELVERCSFVVCPYTSISQSGIPQTVFVFNKPIVATDLNGFREIIRNQENGLLSPISDIISLKTNIQALLVDNNLYQKITEGVKNFDRLFPDYSWEHISDKYITDFM